MACGLGSYWRTPDYTHYSRFVRVVLIPEKSTILSNLKISEGCNFCRVILNI